MFHLNKIFLKLPLHPCHCHRLELSLIFPVLLIYCDGLYPHNVCGAVKVKQQGPCSMHSLRPFTKSLSYMKIKKFI